MLRRIHTSLRARCPNRGAGALTRTGLIALSIAMAAALPALAGAADVYDETPFAPVDPSASTPALTAELPTGGASTTDAATPTGDASIPAPVAAGDALGLGQPAGDELEGRTLKQLNALRDRLREERATALQRLQQLEVERTAAELRLDTAVDAWSRQLVAAYENGGGPRLSTLAELRDASDPVERERLLALLPLADQDIVAAQDAATTAVERAAATAEAQRNAALALGSRISAVENAIDVRNGTDAAGIPPKGNADAGTVIDADLIFATGPIPGIGYWGQVSGGGMLSGWMGMAGAAVGGIGCTVPDATMQPTGAIEQGEASWYGPGFHGNPTANGEVFDTNAMTAAHKTLPLGTLVRVYSSVTARCAFVRINDRGPYVDGRIIDLSRAAADAIGMESVAPVQVEVWTAPTTAPAAGETLLAAPIAAPTP